MAIREIHPKQNNKSYSIIIPAAGIGRRMRSYGPKALLKLTQNLDIITNQINIIKKSFDNYEIILITGFAADKLMNQTPTNIIKIENERYDDTNVLRSIGMGLRAAKFNDVIIIYGDLVFTTNIFQGIVLHDKSVIFVSDNKLMPEEIGCTIDNNIIEYFCYHLPIVWAQIAFLTGKELKIFKSIAWNRDKERLFGFEAMNELLEKGGVLVPHILKNSQIIDVDSSNDLQVARTMFK